MRGELASVAGGYAPAQEKTSLRSVMKARKLSMMAPKMQRAAQIQDVGKKMDSDPNRAASHSRSLMLRVVGRHYLPLCATLPPAATRQLPAVAGWRCGGGELPDMRYSKSVVFSAGFWCGTLGTVPAVPCAAFAAVLLA